MNQNTVLKADYMQAQGENTSKVVWEEPETTRTQTRAGETEGNCGIAAIDAQQGQQTRKRKYKRT